VAPDPVGCVVSLGPARWVTVPGMWHQFQAQEPGFGGFLGRGHLGLFLIVMPRGRSFPRLVEFFFIGRTPSLLQLTECVILASLFSRYEHPLLVEKREKGEWVLPITVYAPPLRRRPTHGRNDRSVLPGNIFNS